MIKELYISGLRSFGEAQTINFAIPDNINRGSGLTIITGSNNSGKTTIIEAMRSFNGRESPTFSEGKRNTLTEGRIEIKITDEDNNTGIITSLADGGSSTQKCGTMNKKFYIVPSRRAISFEFNKNNWNKQDYLINAHGFQNQRSYSLNSFESRIFQIEKHKENFDEILKLVLGKDFKWTIEQRDSGQYYIKYINDNIVHSAEGIGDGIWSIFTICASLFDIKEGDTVVIDEPELSIHPALQKRLLDLLLDYSKKYQIIISTHSPYFIDWNAIVNGAKLIRITKNDKISKCYSVSKDCVEELGNIHKHINNPHVLGLEAKEVFFLEDCIVLVEGQEDVVIFNKIANELGIEMSGNFFGWGVDGAENMGAFLHLFNDLGYKHIVAILDGNKKEAADILKKKYKQYHVITLETDDIRDKKERKVSSKVGLTNERGKLKEENKDYAIGLLNKINELLGK